MASRTWIKLYCGKWIEGTIREETPLVRAVFVDLLALAGSGMYGDSGEIKLQNGVGLTDFQLKTILHLTQKQWADTRLRLQKTGRIAINSGGVITISNWGRYQSEYARQRQYRSNKKLQPKVTTESYDRERDRDIDIEPLPPGGQEDNLYPFIKIYEPITGTPSETSRKKLIELTNQYSTAAVYDALELAKRNTANDLVSYAAAVLQNNGKQKNQQKVTQKPKPSKSWTDDEDSRLPGVFT